MLVVIGCNVVFEARKDSLYFKLPIITEIAIVMEDDRRKCIEVGIVDQIFHFEHRTNLDDLKHQFEKFNLLEMSSENRLF